MVKETEMKINAFGDSNIKEKKGSDALNDMQTPSLQNGSLKNGYTS